MNCIFCHRPASREDEYYCLDNCWTCNTNYYSDGKEIESIQIAYQNYIVEINLHNQSSRFLKLDDRDIAREFCQLNYLIFVCPSNIAAWIDKIEKVMTFT